VTIVLYTPWRRRPYVLRLLRRARPKPAFVQQIEARRAERPTLTAIQGGKL
jgi:hypothetical protein